MLGNNDRLKRHLQANGKRADAEVLAAKERPWANKRAGEIGAAGVWRLKLRVAPAGEPAFETEITDEWRGLLNEPEVGMTVAVLYDPQHHSKVVLAGRAKAAAADPELAFLDEVDEPAAPSGSQARLDRLQQLADLHERGVLSDDEFVSEKARILSEG